MTSRVCQLKQDWQVVSQTEEERRERVCERERKREGVRVDSARSGDNTICLSIYLPNDERCFHALHSSRASVKWCFIPHSFFFSSHHQFIWTLERLRELSKSFYSRCRTCFCATEISMFYLPFLLVLCLIMAM